MWFIKDILHRHAHPLLNVSREGRNTFPPHARAVPGLHNLVTPALQEPPRGPSAPASHHRFCPLLVLGLNLPVGHHLLATFGHELWARLKPCLDLVLARKKLCLPP